MPSRTIQGCGLGVVFQQPARATITFEIHAAPGDYYRFSPQAFKEVLFDGMDAVEVRTIMLPPRIIGAGIKAVPLS